MGPRCGAPTRTWPTTAFAWPDPTGTFPSIAGLSMIIVPLDRNDEVTVRRTRMAGRPDGRCVRGVLRRRRPSRCQPHRRRGRWVVGRPDPHGPRTEPDRRSGIRVSRQRKHHGDGCRPVGAGRLHSPATARARDALDDHSQQLADVFVDSIVTTLTSARIMRGQMLGTHEGPLGVSRQAAGIRGRASGRARVAGDDGR